MKFLTFTLTTIFIAGLIPQQYTYANEPMKDNKYYCERLSEYHLGDDESEITSYCADLIK
jgi:hypothetical protein